jgi:parvulin-like peptidyl-prolyl isomerase
MVIVMLLTGISAGCKGRSIKVENPVFAEAPPRRSLVNNSADEIEARITQGENTADTQLDVNQVGLSRTKPEKFTGSTVVAEVNGTPVFVDDVLGGGRQIIENDPKLSDQQKQMVIETALKRRLPKHIEDELIMQALQKKIPKDKRESIKESLEPQFVEFVEQVKKDNKFTTDEELEQKLAAEGSTLKSLRDLFMRSQMIDGYVFSLIKVPDKIDREELLQYYHDHISEYTPEEKVRYAEIVVRFREHGGEDGAKKAMTTIVNQLQNGEDFGDVAEAMSDALSAEQRGDKGWIKRGELSDTALEEMLFELPADQMTRVVVRPERFEVYKVIDHRKPEQIPFQTVQKDIEKKLMGERRKEASELVREEITSQGNVVTMFDNEPVATTGTGVTPVSGSNATPFQ